MWQGAESRRKKKTQGSKNHMLSSAFAALKLSDFLFLPYLWFYLIIYKMQVSNQRQRQTSKSVVFQFEGDRLRATLFWPFFTGAIIQKARISPWRRKTTVERERDGEFDPVNETKLCNNLYNYSVFLVLLSTLSDPFVVPRYYFCASAAKAHPICDLFCSIEWLPVHLKIKIWNLEWSSLRECKILCKLMQRWS